MKKENHSEIISLNSSELDNILDEAPEKEKPLQKVKIINVTHLPLLQKEIFEKNVLPSHKTEEELDEDQLSGPILAEVKHILLTLDELLGKLPEEEIKQFALSKDYTRYINLLKRLELDHVISHKSR